MAARYPIGKHQTRLSCELGRSPRRGCSADGRYQIPAAGSRGGRRQVLLSGVEPAVHIGRSNAINNSKSESGTSRHSAMQPPTARIESSSVSHPGDQDGSARNDELQRSDLR
jgi:hypothetical protein